MAKKELITTKIKTTANIVTMVSVPRAGSFDTRYRLTELAAEYLRRHHKTSQQVWTDVNARKNQLTALKEEMAVSVGADPYAVSTVRPRDTGDLVVGKMLRTVLQRFRKGDDAEIDSIIGGKPVITPVDYKFNMLTESIGLRFYF